MCIKQIPLLYLAILCLPQNTNVITDILHLARHDLHCTSAQPLLNTDSSSVLVHHKTSTRNIYSYNLRLLYHDSVFQLYNTCFKSFNPKLTSLEIVDCFTKEPTTNITQYHKLHRVHSAPKIS